MSNLEENKDILYTFMSNELNVTKRAVRTMEDQNPKRVQREAIGALIQNAGYSFSDIYEYMGLNSSFFNLEESFKKVGAFNAIEDALGNSSKKHDVIRNSALASFLETYFKNHTNEYSGYFKIYHGREEGGVEYIDVTSIDYISSYETRKSERFKLKNIDDLIRDIQAAFPEYKYQEKKIKTLKNTQTIRVQEEREFSDHMIMLLSDQLSNIKKNEVFVNFHKISCEGVNITLSEINKYNQLDTLTEIDIKGHVFQEKSNDEDEVKMEFYQYLMNTMDALKIKKNKAIQLNIDILEKISMEDVFDEDNDVASMEFSNRVDNIFYLMLDSLCNGLSYTIRKAKEDLPIYRQSLFTMKRNALKLRGWDEVEKNTYEKTFN